MLENFWKCNTERPQRRNYLSNDKNPHNFNTTHKDTWFKKCIFKKQRFKTSYINIHRPCQQRVKTLSALLWFKKKKAAVVLLLYSLFLPPVFWSFSASDNIGVFLHSMGACDGHKQWSIAICCPSQSRGGTLRLHQTQARGLFFFISFWTASGAAAWLEGQLSPSAVDLWKGLQKKNNSCSSEPRLHAARQWAAHSLWFINICGSFFIH